MQTLIASTALAIIPVFIAWSLFSNRFLNKDGDKAARIAEALAWSGFASASTSSLLWLLSGKESFTWGIGAETIFGVKLDVLSVPLLILVSFLAAIIIRFSRNYMGGDQRQGEFVKWICVTLGSVLTLILAPGLLQFAAAWVITSFSLHKLLVFFPNRHGTLFSARKKFLISQIADVALITAFTGLYLKLGTQKFETIFASIQSGQHELGWIGWLIAFAAILKSAQFPFHTWLPDTMGTPTPVSALMHAGIINGGGILLIRFSPLFSSTASPLYAVAVIGAVTAVFGSFVMLSQTSIKRSLAYSTIAQMGFMLMQCGLGAFHLALLHIIAHSLYKAHSFLSSGSSVDVIESLSTEATADRETHLPLFAAICISFALVFGLTFATTNSLGEKPGIIALGVVVAMATSQLMLRQLRRDINFASIARVTAASAGIAAAYLALASLASWWMTPLLTEIPSTPLSFEISIAFVLFVALATTLQLQSGSRFLIPLKLRNALYVHALNGFYTNTLANRILKLIKLQPKQA